MKAFELCARLGSLAVFFQCLELLLIREAWSECGVWRWSTLRRDLRGLDAFLSERGFSFVLIAGAVAAGLGIVRPDEWVLTVMFAVSLLASVRFRGSFNGGSDSMTLIVLGSLSVGAWTDWQKAALAFIAIQLCASYFIAGVIKLRRPTWRSGQALRLFAHSGLYEVPVGVLSALDLRGVSRLGSWLVMAFELLFPLALLSSCGAQLAVGVGLVFHLGNFYVFGLNRFFFAWAAAYPALLYFARAF